MKRSNYQKKLSLNPDSNEANQSGANELRLSKELLKNWQERVHNYQAKFFQGLQNIHHQGSFFEKSEEQSLDSIEPLSLTPLPLSFWRWPECPHHGPAIYLVMDQLENSNSHILLYIGETIAANRRWKGNHDCKSYLSAYSEALVRVGISNQLTIRFWSDVPKETRSRRQLEQQLIKRWLPPFNKETRKHWSTPFTGEIN